MTITKEDVLASIKDVYEMRLTHEQWAAYFENNPAIEKRFVKTGDWDSAKIQREFVVKYDKILVLLRFILKEKHYVNR